MNNSHLFRSGGKCVWCGTTPEKVADRRAPPRCDQRPEDLRDDDADDGRSIAGY